MNQSNEGPGLIQGGQHADERGTASFVNDAQAIRFYEKPGWTRRGSGSVWTGLMEKAFS